MINSENISLHVGGLWKREKISTISTCFGASLSLNNLFFSFIHFVAEKNNFLGRKWGNFSSSRVLYISHCGRIGCAAVLSFFVLTGDAMRAYRHMKFLS
jgi:hypothetical protein